MVVEVMTRAGGVHMAMELAAGAAWWQGLAAGMHALARASASGRGWGQLWAYEQPWGLDFRYALAWVQGLVAGPCTLLRPRNGSWCHSVQVCTTGPICRYTQQYRSMTGFRTGSRFTRPVGALTVSVQSCGNRG